jgi:hypothetical protein
MAMAFCVQIVRALEGDISLEDLNDNEGVRPGQSMAFGTAAAAAAATSYKAKAPGPYTHGVERIRQAPTVYSGAVGRPSTIVNDGDESREPHQ